MIVNIGTFFGVLYYAVMLLLFIRVLKSELAKMQAIEKERIIRLRDIMKHAPEPVETWTVFDWNFSQEEKDEFRRKHLGLQ